MATTPRRFIRPRPPTQPLPTGGNGVMTFPSDLTAGNRQFYTTIGFQQYGMGIGGVNIGGFFGATGAGAISLPLPRKINDMQTVIWEEASIVAAGLAAASAGASALGKQGIAGAIQGMGGGLGNIATGVLGGVRFNPQLVMLFKQPNFKEWNLQWTLAANSEQESETIRNIVNLFKKNMSPGKTGSGTFYTYPSIAQIEFHPKSDYLTRLKPAAIMSVQADYTAAGQPSFFKSGAPTVVNLTVSLREIELWTQEDFT